MAASSFDVRIWKVRIYERRRGKTYGVRWVVAGRPFHGTFSTSALADSHRSRLLSAARGGEPFALDTGLPPSMAPKATGPTWFAHAMAFVDDKWPLVAPRSRQSFADVLATITVTLLPHPPGRPALAALRRALYGWAFNTPRRTAGEPDRDTSAALRWIERNSPRLRALEDLQLVRQVLNAPTVTAKGKPAAANTVARRRAVFHSVLGFAVELGHLAAIRSAA